MSLFLHEDGRVLAPTARAIWDQLLASSTDVSPYVDGDVAIECFERVKEKGQQLGKQLYGQLVQEHRRRLADERRRKEYAFAARRRAVQRVGLSEVRDYRLTQLSEEVRDTFERLDQKADGTPELAPIVVLYV